MKLNHETIKRARRTPTAACHRALVAALDVMDKQPTRTPFTLPRWAMATAAAVAVVALVAAVPPLRHRATNLALDALGQAFPQTDRVNPAGFDTSTQTPSTTDHSQATAASTAIPQGGQATSQPSSEPANSDGFHALYDDVAATIYEAGDKPTADGNFSGSADLNGDGKAEIISLDFQSNFNSDKKSAFRIGDTTVQLDLSDVIAIYIVDLNKSDGLMEAAVVDRGASDYVSTQFFQYDGAKILALGAIHGQVQPSLPGLPYNYGILANGNGTIIPALGRIEFVTPNITIAEKQLVGSGFTDVALNLSEKLNKQYVWSADTDVYFESDDQVPAKFQPNYDPQNTITLKKGQTILITQINGYQWIEGTLQDGRKGALYYYVMS